MFFCILKDWPLQRIWFYSVCSPGGCKEMNALNLNGQLEIAGRAIKNNGNLDDDDGQVLVSSFLKLANLSSKREHISSPRCSAISIGGSSRKRGFSAVVGIPAVVDPVGAPSECLLLKNMFDPSTETEPEFDFDEHIKEDVKDECSKFGELNHIFVDKNSIGFLSTCHLKMRKQQWECNVLSMMEHEQDDPGVDLPLDGSLESEPICDDPSRIDKADDSGSNEHPNIYRHDIVRNNKTGSIGVVSEVAGDSDSESDISDEENDGGDDDDEEDDDNDDDDAAEEEGKKANEENVGRGEKNYKCGTLEGDQIRVLWMDDTEPVQDVNNVTVVDRGFLHGDYVASSSDPTGQVGVVVDVDMSVDLLALDGSTHKDISTKELKRVRDFCVGDYVVHGPWLGRIDDVLDNVTVLFDDGSMCRVLRAEPLQLKPVSQSNLEEDANFPYYPGQRVKATSSSVFKSSRWLSGLWKPNRLEGTVTKVTAGSIFVYWIASAGFGPDSAVSPPEEQSPSNLTLLSSFTHANWQVGDWGLLPSVNQSATIPLHKHVSKLRLYDSQAKRADREQNKSDLKDELSEEKSEPVGITAEALPKEITVSSTSKEPAHEPWPLHRKKIRKLVIRKDKRVKKKEESFERALLIVSSRTLVDVAWQDGTVECRREATTLIPIETPGDQEFVPEQYVVEKASDDDDNTTEPKRVGVVKSVNAKERTASVRWLKPRLTAEEPREFDKEEIASVYELEVHPDYDYCYGDVVVRLSPVTMALPASSEATEQDDGHQDAEYHQEAKVHDKEENEVDTNIPELSWVGNITGLKDGDIEVTWADGMVSTVGPQAIYVVGRDDDESIAAESEASDAASWETVDDDNGGAPEEDLGRGSFLEENSDAGNNGENDSGRNGALALPLAAVEFVTRMASGIFSRGQKAEDSSSSSLTDDNGLTNSSHERGSFLDDHSPTNFSATDNCDLEGTVVENEAVERSEGEKSEEPIPSESDSCSFKRFDISQDPLDHHYLGSDEQKTKERRWFKKVDQDWKILQNNLPDGIFVRVYEDRMDLLRAVIAGAYGTPYQDGLFFFDFHLPSDYPSVPPDFEELIKDHFRKRGYYILKACDAYMKGYLIGSLSKDASVIDESCSANSNSVGFKLMLAKIAPKLFSALSEVGADCNEFKHLQQQQ
ncbi:hypothetical protein IGI04_012474 [Brassica rapa subsp. trilocularis]|uniref:UBC core domain-containing protein n=1 Tax=Brassica rapa subsp. trilocularis TaxID=1813537 RepID=A0ABQ7N633_BRACM|nr:hypothetical protein IGI04_012474 [Brassica rapa subsp. trilocularis]